MLGEPFFILQREKARILYLFNDLYKKRQGYARHMRHQVRRNARKNTLSVSYQELKFAVTK